MNSLAWSDLQALAYIASYSDLRIVFGANPESARRHYAQVGATEGRVVTFDALGYLASHSDLRGVFGSDTMLATRHFIETGAAEGRTVSFDALAYVASYSDLTAAFGTNTAAATRHYVETGAAEGRTVSFDALAYVASYSDLTAAFGTNTAAATRHYVETGAAEGRTVSFDALAYVASYSDLTAAFGTNTAAATRHYVETGAAEGRTVSFDALAYVASYSDLTAAFGTNTAAATRHYVETGAAEGRTVSFDSVAHLLSQPDLIAAGYTAPDALRHWISYGFAEGRTASGSFGNEQFDHDLQLSAMTDGMIDHSGDSDWFRIDLIAGKGISLELLMGSGSGTLSIHDATGRALPAGDIAGSRTSFIAPSSGTYYVVVSATNNAVGAYNLTANDYYTITGTFNGDTLTGTGGADVLRGLEGSDILNGRGGNDVLEGGSGYDQLDGGLGDDVLYGNNALNSGFDSSMDSLSDDQGGNDRLFGQDGNDYLSVSRYNFNNGSIAPSTVLLDGGLGDDSIRFNASSRHLDSVTINGGFGNDDIHVGSVLSSRIDAGDGNDKVTIDLSGGEQTITLGSGADTLSFARPFGSLAIGNINRVTDFQTGTDTLSVDQYLADALLNWDKTSNPFSTGHLKLVQSGSDTLLQIDRDGSASGSYAPATLLTFANTTATSFSAKDLGYAPDGSEAVGQTITGTFNGDTLTGTGGADVLRGLEGSDILNGRGGNDVLEGGSGYDQLDGGLGDDVLYGNNALNSGFDSSMDSLSDDQGGNDRLFGQDGNDYLSVSRYNFNNGSIAPSTVLLDGGLGDDSIRFNASSRHLDSVTINGGFGNDDIHVGSVLSSRIDAGDGNDKVTIDLSGGEQTITLGSGADTLSFARPFGSLAIGNINRVTDFQTGTDTLSVDQYLADALLNWDKTSNPFSTGHLKLVQSGSDTLLQIDRDGSASGSYAPATLLTFANTTATSFSAKDLGYAPDGSEAVGQTITGTFNGDTLTGTGGADVLRGLEGSDILNGRGGNDVLEGGSGYDQLDGGLGDDVLYGNNALNSGFDSSMDSLSDDQGGNDRLFGQDGNDYLSVSRYNFNNGSIAPSTVLLDGGLGDDSIRFNASSRHLDSVTINGGFGNDDIHVGSVLSSRIDAGDGNDKVTIDLSGGEQTITLGSGADTLSFARPFGSLAIGNINRVTDFQTGTDTLSVDQYLADALLNWDKTSNPFSTGHLKLVQSGSDTLLQIDRDGSASGSYAPATLLTFANTTATSFSAKDLGYAPDGSEAVGQNLGSVTFDISINHDPQSAEFYSALNL